MASSVVLGMRTACSPKPYIRSSRVSSSLFSRKLGTKNGIGHRLANTRPRSSVSGLPLGPCRLFATSPSAFELATKVSPRECADADDNVLDLVLSEAQRRTIYALSSPPGKAGVAVIRVSGPEALHVWRGMVKMLGEGKGKMRERDPQPWKMHRCSVVHPESGEALDDGLAVFFRGPRSFTTEDVLELHVHSGRAIISSVLNAISFFPFCRPAERGEFTRRAFEGGRLDLTQVEGLRDLIDAETESQRKLALRTAGGVTRTRLETLRNDIIQCQAMVEALIDFGEDAGIEEENYEQARERASKLRSTIQYHLSDNRRGEIMRSGIRLAIFGPPNAGKSSLLNFLAQREAAIVTSIPGTTRDILELSLDIGGLPVIVADTAGLRKTDDVVESIGVDRAQKLVESSDVSLCVLSAPEAFSLEDGYLTIPPSVAPLITDNTFVVLNKADLLSSPLHLPKIPQKSWIVSLNTGEGLRTFMEGFGHALQERYHMLSENGPQAEEPLITHARHRSHLEDALKFLDAFLNTPSEDIVFAAEELRYAAQAIGRITGLIDVEDVLDAVFRDFCIGK